MRQAKGSVETGKWRHRDGQRAATRWARGGVEMGIGGIQMGKGCTMVWNKQEERSTGPLARSLTPLVRSHCSFAHTARSLTPLTRFGLLALLVPFAAQTHLLTCSLCSLPRSWESELLTSQNDLVLSHSGLGLRQAKGGIKMGKGQNVIPYGLCCLVCDSVSVMCGVSVL